MLIDTSKRGCEPEISAIARVVMRAGLDAADGTGTAEGSRGELNDEGGTRVLMVRANTGACVRQRITPASVEPLVRFRG